MHRKSNPLQAQNHESPSLSLFLSLALSSLWLWASGSLISVSQWVPRKSLKNKRNFAPPRSRNPLKKLEDENHAVGAPRVLAWVPKKDLPAGKRYTASYRQMKKDTVRGCDDGGGGGVVIPFPASPDRENISGPTTIMIKNIPNQFQRCDLLTVLRNHCRDENLQACTKGVTTKSEFDFVYLPMDFMTANLGYAFVNFTSFTAAKRFYKKFHNEQWKVRSNKKTCEITCAKVQGLEALKKNFESKVFRCHTEEYLPAVVEPPCDGVLQQPKVTPVGTRVGLPLVDY
ncbi:protein MEI2-like 6 [Pyrus ussuriensis x Pyrus communis]|uniref:Protein MEI2-like 6 n=1 Tax=Pyrus ussuriensis x Pyrus communis TaxID=2448454 RepID=A0A5N5HMA5_9ROSA|nr:protein MEI2-like 6 [Pyrus ussuriensis x Pyrus communis]